MDEHLFDLGTLFNEEIRVEEPEQGTSSVIEDERQVEPVETIFQETSFAIEPSIEEPDLESLPDMKAFSEVRLKIRVFERIHEALKLEKQNFHENWTHFDSLLKELIEYLEMREITEEFADLFKNTFRYECAKMIFGESCVQLIDDDFTIAEPVEPSNLRRRLLRISIEEGKQLTRTIFYEKMGEYFRILLEKRSKKIHREFNEDTDTRLSKLGLYADALNKQFIRALVEFDTEDRMRQIISDCYLDVWKGFPRELDDHDE